MQYFRVPLPVPLFNFEGDPLTDSFNSKLVDTIFMQYYFIYCDFRVVIILAFLIFSVSNRSKKSLQNGPNIMTPLNQQVFTLSLG